MGVTAGGRGRVHSRVVMKAHGVSALAVVTVVVGLGAAPLGFAQTEPAVPLEGRYAPASAATNAEAIERAIERTAEPFFFAIRGIVRSRLRDANPVFPFVEIRTQGEVIECNTPPVLARDADDGRASSVMGLDQNRNNLTHHRVGNTLAQTTWNADGTRHTRFVPTGASGLTVHVEVSSPRLSVPLRYVMHYRRVGP